jgi:flagellar P-ring protein precursor FlgI
MRARSVLCLAVALCAALAAPAAAQVRVKDVVRVQGVRENNIYGYGIVMGLNGTGDRATSSPFTPQTIANMLQRLGIALPPLTLNNKNAAAVIVTAKLPPFIKLGMTMDVTLSSLGDATTLQGGTLLLTPLQGPDGRVYALAQGPISVGGILASSGGDSVQKNHPTVARIPQGAVVEREVPSTLDPTAVVLQLQQPDFSTAVRLADVVSGAGLGTVARASDPTTVIVPVPAAEQARLVQFIARIESLPLRVDAPARVVINERTGTVVLGSHFRVATVAIAHGNLTIQVQNDTAVSQPGAFAPNSAQTVVVPRADVQVREERGRLSLVPEGASIGDVVQALNALGVTPRDLISILQAIRQAGALLADLDIM